MTHAPSTQKGQEWLATPVQQVSIFSTGGQVLCAVDEDQASVCERNPAPNATQPFVPSLAFTVSVRSQP